MMGGCLWLKRYLGTDGTESVPKMNGGKLKFEISTDVWLWMNERVTQRIKKLLSILSAEMMCHLHSSSFFCDL
jgi:hypothetical protein